MRKADWLIPIGLMLLGVVPFVAGVLRMIELGGGSVITPENARFFDDPLPVVIHIATSLTFSILGALQFSPGLRRSRPHWHRISGRILVLPGIASAVSGLWMTLFYPNADANFDSSAVYVLRLIAGTAMAWSLAAAIAAIRTLDIAAHQRWMTRAYALGLGAGTQVFTHIPWFVWPEVQGELLRSLCMGAGWMLNIAVAEWILLRASWKLGISTGRKSINGGVEPPHWLSAKDALLPSLRLPVNDRFDLMAAVLPAPTLGRTGRNLIFLDSRYQAQRADPEYHFYGCDDLPGNYSSNPVRSASCERIAPLCKNTVPSDLRK